MKWPPPDDLGQRGGAGAQPRAPAPDRLALDLSAVAHIFDASPIGVGVWTVDGELSYANPVLCDLLGRPLSDLEGEIFDDFVHPEDAESTVGKISDIWAGRRNYFECDLRCRAPDRSTVWVRAFFAAVYGRDAKPSYLISQMFNFAGGGGRDHRLRRLANNAPVMLWLTDASGFPRFGNRLCFDFIGVHRPSGDLGHLWSDAVHAEDLRAVESTLDSQIRGQQPFEFVARSRRKDGEWRWLHHRAQPMFDQSGAFEGYAGSSFDVTDIELSREELRVSRELFASVSEAGPVAVVRTDAEGKITYFNGRWAEILDDHEERLPDFGWQDILPPEYVDLIMEAGVESVATRRPFTLRVRARPPRAADGMWFWGDVRAAPLFDESDRHVGFSGTLIDVTAEVEAASRADRLAHVLDASLDFVFLAHPTGALTYANGAAREVLGVTVAPSAESGSFLWDVLDRDSTEVYYEVVEPMLQREGVWRGEMAVVARDHRTVAVSAVFLAHKDDVGSIESISAVARDIRDVKDAEQQLRHVATHDVLTGLPNRALLYDRLEQALARHQRMGHGVTLLFCDLDRFKPVNDEYGHDVGDAALREIADRIGDVVRATDTAARVGGDEFVVLVEGVEDLELLVSVAERLRETISRPIVVGDREVRVGVSIGLVVAAEGRDDVDLLMRLADRAMYRAKAAGRGRVEVVGP
jgi:diguanylate cyclase (GGDEF)-like protein/PAS domain S-box-containing protein